MMIGLFDKSIAFLSKALDVLSIRHQLIASNIANQDTPNYKPRDISFKKELESFLDTNKKDIYLTHAGHLNGQNNPDSGVEVIIKNGEEQGYDNSSVNVEMEMANMAMNAILYDAAAQIVSKKLKMLGYAIREVR